MTWPNSGSVITRYSLTATPFGVTSSTESRLRIGRSFGGWILRIEGDRERDERLFADLASNPSIDLSEFHGPQAAHRLNAVHRHHGGVQESRPK